MVILREANIDKALRQALQMFEENPPDLLGTGDKEGERKYVLDILPSYKRTVSDLYTYLSETHSSLDGIRIAELGAFLGVVSKTLSFLGAEVIACDIPAFMETANTREYYERLNIETSSFNLRDYRLPFQSGSLDAIIACEIFEHLNFNPLPVFKEISRVLKMNGVLYIAMPNGGYIGKRIKFLLSGRLPLFSINELIAQLDSSQNMVVGLHWREYTTSETLEMVLPHGFRSVFKKEVNDTGGKPRGGLSSKLKSLLRVVLPGGHTQVHLFKKISEAEQSYSINRDM
jgi:SAM-dependent methyltransferase